MKKKLIIVIISVVAVGLLLTGIRLYFYYNEYTDFKILSTIEEGEGSSNQYYEFSSGYLKINNQGIAYVDGKETIWNQPFTIERILLDITGDYVAISSKNSNDVYVCSKKGLVAKLKTDYPVMDLEVTKKGLVAVVLKEESVSYIEVIDQQNNKIVSLNTYLESNGYPLDMSISEDGKKMVVSYVFFDSGKVSTKLVFYDFSDAHSTEEEKIAGGFNHYQSTIVPAVEFLDNDTVVAFGDDIFTVYSVGNIPKIKHEEKLETEIKSVFYNDNYFGFVLVNNTGSAPYSIKIYNKNGGEKAFFDFSFAYTDLHMDGKNIIMYNESSCEIYNFSGVKKFRYTFDDEINSIVRDGLFNKYLFALKNSVQEVRLK